MDVNATLKMLLEAIEENNVEDSMHYSNSIDGWIQFGGFPPDAIDKKACLQLVRAVYSANIDVCHDEIDESSFAETVNSYVAKQRIGYDLV